MTEAKAAKNANTATLTNLGSDSLGENGDLDFSVVTE